MYNIKKIYINTISLFNQYYNTNIKYKLSRGLY